MRDEERVLGQKRRLLRVDPQRGEERALGSCEVADAAVRKRAHEQEADVARVEVEPAGGGVDRLAVTVDGNERGRAQPPVLAVADVVLAAVENLERAARLLDSEVVARQREVAIGRVHQPNTASRARIPRPRIPTWTRPPTSAATSPGTRASRTARRRRPGRGRRRRG